MRNGPELKPHNSFRWFDSSPEVEIGRTGPPTKAGLGPKLEKACTYD